MTQTSSLTGVLLAGPRFFEIDDVNKCIARANHIIALAHRVHEVEGNEDQFHAALQVYHEQIRYTDYAAWLGHNGEHLYQQFCKLWHSSFNRNAATRDLYTVHRDGKPVRIAFLQDDDSPEYSAMILLWECDALHALGIE